MTALGKWLPIESAPKDGSKVILAIISATDGARDYIVAEWIEAGGDCGWLVARMGTIKFATADTPTHWMPLPDPPVTI